MIRDIQLATMGYVQHPFDDANRTFSYTLTGSMPLGMQDYSVVATVTPIDEGHCTIRWAGTTTADGSLDESDIGTRWSWRSRT